MLREARLLASTRRGRDLLHRPVGEQTPDRAGHLGQRRAPRTPRPDPPPISTSRLTAAAMSLSSTPTTTTLCASWAWLEARAPRWSPKPRTKPRPIRPGALVAFDHGDLGQVHGPGPPRPCPSRGAASSTQRPGHDLAGTPRRSPAPGRWLRTTKASAGRVRTRTLSRIHSGACARRYVQRQRRRAPTSRPRFHTATGRRTPGRGRRPRRPGTPGPPRRTSAQAVVARGVQGAHGHRVVRGSSPDATALRMTALMCPSSQELVRLAVVGAEQAVGRAELHGPGAGAPRGSGRPSPRGS